VFSAPGFLLEEVFDPTGAGDTFAGGLMGYLAAQGDLGTAALRRAVIFGSALASYAVESFSVDRVHTLTHQEIAARFRAFQALTRFDDADPWGGR
jgi:sugar/nucleoside kinase (ribokinase family)